MTVSTITTYSGTVPKRSGQEQSEFSGNVDDLLTYMPVLTADWNTAVGEFNTDKDIVEGWKNDTEGFKNDTQTIKDDAVTETEAIRADAETAQLAAQAAANYIGRWTDQTGSQTVPASTSHNARLWMLLEDVADITAAEPSAASTVWEAINGRTIVDRSSNTMFTVADLDTIVNLTGTFTQTFDTAANMEDGWSIVLKNAGAGDITLDPSGGETIDGLSSFVMYPGEMRLIYSDGTNLHSHVIKGFSKVFTGSSTFTKPPGYSDFGGLAWSAGSSGAKGSSDAPGGGGGGCFPFCIPEFHVGTTESIIIGAGGVPVTSESDGNTGGSTSFGSMLAVSGAPEFAGGGGMVFGSSVFSRAPDSTASVNTLYRGATMDRLASEDGGSSIYGGAAGGGHESGLPDAVRSAGTSKFGGDGGAGADNTDGQDGVAPGGGGGGTKSGSTSGAGARGELRIWGIV